VHAAAFAPSQVPPQAEPSEVQAARVPCGAPETVEQMPSPPDTSHAWHCPVQALPQQYPSTQKPVAHSLLALQAVPCDLMKVPTIACAVVTFETM
jgi:hypothetical protein